jgi:3'(2'), 5'-bisphosphate nucleotidase
MTRTEIQSGALSELLPQVLSLAEEAGKVVMDIYSGRDFGTAYKENESPVTHADIASHAVIAAGLSHLTPNLPLLSEESTAVPCHERQSWHVYWLIDPLDGTKEFIKRNGEFTVNICLIEGRSPVLGVVHAPALNVTYWGARGMGSYKRMSEGPAVRITVSDYRTMPLKLVASRSHAGDALSNFIDKIVPGEFISMGSSLKICLVAEGSAHLYPRLGPTMEWDTAAAQCVLEQGGGVMTDLTDNALIYNKADLVNPPFIASSYPPFPWQRYL